jgi:hypothetical protein
LLLGLFVSDNSQHSFESALDPPDRIPAAHFSMPLRCDNHFHGCRHGLGVFISEARDDVIVWDPLTGRRRRVPFPEWFPKRRRLLCRNAEVLCDALSNWSCCETTTADVRALTSTIQRMELGELLYQKQPFQTG